MDIKKILLEFLITPNVIFLLSVPANDEIPLQVSFANPVTKEPTILRYVGGMSKRKNVLRYKET